MESQTLLMARNKKESESPKVDREKYRKTFKPVRIRAILAEIATSRASELAQDFTQYVNDAVRMRLESEGQWPPKSSSRR